MKIRNIIAAILLSTCIAVTTEIAVQPTANTTATDYETASGLIEKCSLSCSDSDRTLKIYAKTQASGIMNKIGFVNIIIQRSTDMNNWTDEKNIGDFLESDSRYYTLSRTETVSGGFYYRIVCTHYADGIPFRSNSAEIQTADNISKAVWINPSPETSAPAPVITTSTMGKTTSVRTTVVSTDVQNAGTVLPAPIQSGKILTTQTSQAGSTALRENKTSTATSSEKSTTETKSDNSPFTSSNFPVSAIAASVIAIITAVLSHKKSK